MFTSAPEMHVKTTMSCHHTLISVTETQKVVTPSAGEDTNAITPMSQGGMENGTATLGNSGQVLTKLNICSPPATVDCMC